MKKELGKWFLDIAKYLATAGLIAPWIGGSEQYGIWIFLIIGLFFLLTLTIGLRILKREDIREKNRNKNKKGLNMSLNKENKNPAYLLGRLFATLEMTQNDSSGGVNAGVGDSHYSASNDSYGSQLKQNLNASVGLSLSVPIFDNRRNKTSVEKAKLQQTTAALDILDKQTTLGSNIENLWLQANSAQQRFIAARTAVESQETNYELINEQFRSGLKNIVDLLQARDNLLQAQQNKLQSKYTTILNIQLLRFYENGQISL